MSELSQFQSEELGKVGTSSFHKVFIDGIEYIFVKNSRIGYESYLLVKHKEYDQVNDPILKEVSDLKGRFKILIKSRGYKNLGEFAKSMDSNPGTFYNSLKYFVEKQSFNSKFVRRITKTLEMTIDDFQAYLTK